MTDKAKRKQPPQAFRQKYGLLIFVIGWLMITGVLALLFRLQTDAEFEVYYALVPQEFLLFVLLLLILVITPILTLIVIMRSLINLLHRQNVKLTAMLLLCNGMSILTMLTASLMMYGNSYIKPVYYADIQDETYMVARLSDFDDLGVNPYGIYKCDRLQLRCFLVERSSNQFIWWSNIVGIDDDGEQITIEVRNHESDTETYIFRPDD